MKFTMSTAIIVVVWATGLGFAARAEQAAPAAGLSTWSGVFTEEQANDGAKAYTTHCSECHLEDLAGDGVAPALKGPEFLNNWSGLTVADLYERIRVSMPPSDPDAVSPKEKAEIIAHLLKSSAFPAGETELASEVEPLKAIKIEATKPGL